MANNDKPEYSVGYKKPPRHTQFKSGRSGNASGRPKKPKTVRDAFMKQSRKIVTVQITGKPQRISMLDLLAMNHLKLAANGDHKSTALVVRVLEPSEGQQDNNFPELLQEMREKNACNLAAETKQEPDDDSTELDNSGPAIKTGKQGIE